MIGPEPGFVRLYYYTGEQWGMKSLWKKRLKVARYEDLNDPFELIPFNLARKKSRRFYEEKARKLLRKNRGLLCFSESWRTTLMWSHYGEKHTGMCLGFDVSDELAVRVTYVETLLDDPLDDRDEHYGMTLKVFEDALHCKWRRSEPS